MTHHKKARNQVGAQDAPQDLRLAPVPENLIKSAKPSTTKGVALQ